MSGEEIVEKIREQAKTYEESKIYYTLRIMKVRRASDAQTRIVKNMLALRHFGMNIVPSGILYGLYGKSRSALLGVLHLLGDKGILTLIRNQSQGELRYMLSQKFTELWDKNTKDVHSNAEAKDLNTSSGIV